MEIENPRSKSREGFIFCIIFVLMLLYPSAGYFIDKGIELSGVTARADLVNTTPEEVLNGEYQSSLNDYIDQNFWGRKFLINLRSQAMYSLFNVSPNSNVVIGKDKYLYEPGYIWNELALDSTANYEYYAGLIDKLDQLQILLTSEGKELYIFVTPSKGYFCKEYIPQYFADMDEGRENNYQIFSRYLAESDLKYFDAHAYIENYSDEDMNYPVFYPTGIHWSTPWGHKAAIEFEEFINENSKWELSTLSQTIQESDEPNWPDADLYQSLNLISQPANVQYYKSEITITEEKEHPNEFFRGGSFMGQSLNALVQAGVFGEDVHFENGYYFKNNYSESGTLSSFSAYDEFTEMGDLLSKSDILILECNEANAANMSWGFIDYVLEHPDYVKYPDD